MVRAKVSENRNIIAHAWFVVLVSGQDDIAEPLCHPHIYSLFSSLHKGTNFSTEKRGYWYIK